MNQSFISPAIAVKSWGADLRDQEQPIVEHWCDHFELFHKGDTIALKVKWFERTVLFTQNPVRPQRRGLLDSKDHNQGAFHTYLMLISC